MQSVTRLYASMQNLKRVIIVTSQDHDANLLVVVVLPSMTCNLKHNVIYEQYSNVKIHYKALLVCAVSRLKNKG